MKKKNTDSVTCTANIADVKRVQNLLALETFLEIHEEKEEKSASLYELAAKKYKNHVELLLKEKSASYWIPDNVIYYTFVHLYLFLFLCIHNYCICRIDSTSAHEGG